MDFFSSSSLLVVPGMNARLKLNKGGGGENLDGEIYFGGQLFCRSALYYYYYYYYYYSYYYYRGSGGAIITLLLLLHYSGFL